MTPGPTSTHFDAEFVAGDARVAEEGHLAEVAADVGAADADAVDPDQDLAGARPFGFLDRNLFKLAGLFQEDRFHGRVSSLKGTTREGF